ncbi:hypothetical protein KAR91_55315 [Candidatus Pacearchaeota archaeon]|nr:hypothetical protein [Candidatus Pacearchaeota archaeon]
MIDLMDFELSEKRIPVYKIQSLGIAFHEFMDKMERLIAVQLSIPIDLLRVCLDMGCEYQQYRHMWE